MRRSYLNLLGIGSICVAIEYNAKNLSEAILNYAAQILLKFFSNAALLKTVAVMSLQTLSQKEADNYSPERQKQNPNKPQPKQTTQHTKLGSGCGKRDVKRVVKRRETACQFTIQKPSYAQMCTSRKYHSQSNQSRSSPFFLLEAAWLNEVRCPDGRPSVS